MSDRLPAAHLAIIDERKITHYLLAADHPAGRAKARFFAEFGFTVATWQELHAALLLHARDARVVSVESTAFGRKYAIEGPFAALDGRRPRLRAIWFVESGETAPRLVTAYAMARRRR